MTKPKLSFAQRRQESINLITRADLNYFERFMLRRHRVREPVRVEFEQAQWTGMDMSLAAGEQHYIAVLHLPPDACLSLLIPGPANADPYFDEQTVRELFKKS